MSGRLSLEQQAAIQEAAARALQDEFLDDARERLSQLENALLTHLAKRRATPESAGVETVSALLIRLSREVHTLKGMGGSFGFPAISLIAHRLEDYLEAVTVLDEPQVNDILAYLDPIQQVVNEGVSPPDEEVARLLRGLPAWGIGEATVTDGMVSEVLLVSPSKVMARVVETALQAYGIKVVSTRSPLEAFCIGVTAPPDMVISSAVMEPVNGIDLARAFAAMTTTREIPFAVFTSLEGSDPLIRDLPSHVPVIRKGQELEADLRHALSRAGLKEAERRPPEPGA